MQNFEAGKQYSADAQSLKSQENAKIHSSTPIFSSYVFSTDLASFYVTNQHLIELEALFSHQVLKVVFKV